MSAFVINSYAFGADFKPTDIAGCQLWLDATKGLFDATSSGGAVTTDSAEVARWEDQSGNAYHVTQGTSANRPILKTSLKNGKNILRFNGTDFLLGSSNFPISGSSNRSVFTVFNRDDANQRYIVSWGGSGTGGFAGFSSEYYLRFAGTTKGYTNQGTNGSYTIWSVIGNGSTLNNYNAYFDAGGVATSNVGLSGGTTLNTTSSNLAVGTNAFSTSASIADGDLAEIIIYDTALSDSNREKVRDYLNAKWAVY